MALKATDKKKLTAAGVTDPAHHAVLDKALAAGVPLSQILAWIKQYGPGIVSMIEVLINTFKPPVAA